jgi:hypothetical protein
MKVAFYFFLEFTTSHYSLYCILTIYNYFIYMESIIPVLLCSAIVVIKAIDGL